MSVLYDTNWSWSFFIFCSIFRAYFTLTQRCGGGWRELCSITRRDRRHWPRRPSKAQPCQQRPASNLRWTLATSSKRNGSLNNCYWLFYENITLIYSRSMNVVDNLFFLDNKNNDFQLPLTYTWYHCVSMRLFPWLYSVYSLYFRLNGRDMGIFGTKVFRCGPWANSVSPCLLHCYMWADGMIGGRCLITVYNVTATLDGRQYWTSSGLRGSDFTRC